MADPSRRIRTTAGTAPADPRAGRTMTAPELAHFLGHLADTGNFALACVAAGRAKSGLYKRRARDPAFAAGCERALTAFRLNLPSVVVSAPRPRPHALLTSPGDLILAYGRKRPAQLRRAAPGQLTQAGVDTFLRALAATANVRLAAASVGVAHSSIYARRARDPAFAAAMRAALLLGYDLVESALIEAATRAFDDDEEGGGEEDGEADGGGDEEGGGEEDGQADGGGDGSAQVRPMIDDRMTVDQALQLLRLHRRTARDGWATARRQVEVATPAEVNIVLKRRLKQLGWDE